MDCWPSLEYAEFALELLGGVSADQSWILLFGRMEIWAAEHGRRMSARGIWIYQQGCDCPSGIYLVNDIWQFCLGKPVFLMIWTDGERKRFCLSANVRMCGEEIQLNGCQLCESNMLRQSLLFSQLKIQMSLKSLDHVKYGLFCEFC